MTPADYVVSAARVVSLLQNYLNAQGTKQEHHAPLSRAKLAKLLVVPTSKIGKFAQQLQHMQRHHYAEHRISFQHYPTGWIYDPPKVVVKADVKVSIDGGPMHGGQLHLTTRMVAAVDPADIEIVWQWASKQWVTDDVRHALERLRKVSR